MNFYQNGRLPRLGDKSVNVKTGQVLQITSLREGNKFEDLLLAEDYAKQGKIKTAFQKVKRIFQ